VTTRPRRALDRDLRLIGYALLKLGFETGLSCRIRARPADGGEPPPALLISRGRLGTFLERPVSAALLGVALIVLVAAILRVRQKRAEVFTNDR